MTSTMTKALLPGCCFPCRARGRLQEQAAALEKDRAARAALTRAGAEGDARLVHALEQREAELKALHGAELDAARARFSELEALKDAELATFLDPSAREALRGDFESAGDVLEAPRGARPRLPRPWATSPRRAAAPPLGGWFLDERRAPAHSCGPVHDENRHRTG